MGTLTFFFLNHFLGEEQFWYFNFFLSLSFFGRNSSEISLRGWHLVIFRAEQSKKPPCRFRHTHVTQIVARPPIFLSRIFHILFRMFRSPEYSNKKKKEEHRALIQHTLCKQ